MFWSVLGALVVHDALKSGPSETTAYRHVNTIPLLSKQEEKEIVLTPEQAAKEAELDALAYKMQAWFITIGKALLAILFICIPPIGIAFLVQWSHDRVQAADNRAYEAAKKSRGK